MAQNKARSRRRSTAPRADDKAPLYAAVDLGTNNCRLLIAQRHGSYFRVRESYSQLVRLGEGLQESGELSAASMDRTISALTEIRKRLKRRKVSKVRCIATQACRQASNSQAFVQRIQKETGLSFKIISGAEEAHLAAIGCHNLIEQDARTVMVLDIGGGSTEIAFLNTENINTRDLQRLVRKTPIRAWRSFPIGVVTLRDRFIDHRSAPDEGYEAMHTHARELFSGWKKGQAMTDDIGHETAHIIGTSGPVTLLAGVHLDLNAYRRDLVDGSWMARTEAKDVIERVRGTTLPKRGDFPTIGPERADLMVAGCAIFGAALDTFPAPRIRVADRGLREGLLLSMIHSNKKKTRRRRPGKRKTGPVQPTTAQATPANGGGLHE
ncbi:MAG: Ppx/GppA phosphatase family protein [Pseudomonadota bacterium]